MRAFTKGTRKYRDVAAAIFKRELRDTRVQLGDLTAISAVDFVRMWDTPVPHGPEYSWFRTIWARVNISGLVMKQQSSFVKRKERFLLLKIKLFQNNHIDVIKYLETLDDPTDENIDVQYLQSLYKPLPPARFDDDRDYIDMVKTKHQMRRTPLEIIEEAFPQHDWRLENIRATHVGHSYAPLGNVDRYTHQIYYASLTIMEQCKQCYTEGNVGDALYFYYAAFLDLFYYGLGQETPRMDDEFLTEPIGNTDVSPLELYYPYDNRAFTCWDLPDVYHVLFHIPLSGEQRPHQTIIEKYIQKSLPFACQRRTLVKGFTETIETKLGAFVIMSKLFWCMLANLYPETRKTFDMRRLMRAREISASKEIIIEAFRRSEFAPAKDASDEEKDEFKQENFKGCDVIINAFRLWIYAMTYHNTHYAEYADKFIDWKAFVANIFAAQDLLQKADIFRTDDVFVDVRNPIDEKKTKSKSKLRKNIDVYRYRKLSKVAFVLKYLRESLEKDIFSELTAWQDDREKLTNPHLRTQDLEGAPIYDIYTGDVMAALAFCDLKIDQLSQPIPAQIKTDILNTLLRVPIGERISLKAMSMLRLERYGGLSRDSILILQGMLDVYDDGAKPAKIKEFTGFVDNVRTLKIMCWYLTVVLMINSIRFEAIDSNAVHNIHQTFLREKYDLKPGQTLPLHVYDVCITLCCKRIAALDGSKGFGHKKIYFDAVTDTFRCSKTFKKHEDEEDEWCEENGEEDVYTRKSIRDLRRDFSTIVCMGSPVLRINMLGKRLIYGSAVDNIEKYMHCPRCGSFHKYEWINWSGSPDGRYRCGECREKEFEQMLHFTCNQCGVALSNRSVQTYTLTVMTTDEFFKKVYYCKKHYKLAKYLTWSSLESGVERKVANKELKRNKVNR